MVSEAVREKDIVFSESTYGLLMKGYKGSKEKVEALFQEALAKKPNVGAELCLALLISCQQPGDLISARV